MRKAVLIAGVASYLALGGCAVGVDESAVVRTPVERVTVYDKSASEDYDYFEELADYAERMEAVDTASVVVEGVPDPTNNVHDNATWIHDEGYVSECAQVAAKVDSATDQFVVVDRTLCRVAVLRLVDGSWELDAGFDCGLGRKDIDDSGESHTFTGTYKVDHKDELLGGLSWWVCYLPCWTEDGADDGQGFHNLYLGYPGFYSHGCTRLSDVNAKWMFDNLSIGTTVVVRDNVV